MNKFIETIKNIFKIEELREKILYTLGLILIYRIGSFVPLPGIDPNALEGVASEGGLMALLNMFVGGSFTRASVFALGIMPYISASIAVQLLTLIVPFFQKMQSDGESGRKKITQLTRYLTLAVTFVQGSAYITYLNTYFGNAIVLNMFMFSVSTLICLTAGTVFCMWLGEKITDRGIGNGISLLITVGIIANLPGAMIQEAVARFSAGGAGPVFFLLEIAIWVAIIFACVALVQAVRKIPVQYARRMMSGDDASTEGVRDYIPLKVNASGVMPIIFAQALMFIPSFVGQIFPNSSFMSSINSGTFFLSFGYNIAFFILIVVFTYFYTALTINPVQMAEDMQRNNGFIPGIKPGEATSDYIDMILSRITLPGAIFLGLIAILPAIASNFGIAQGFALFFGGTSLLILVSVVLDTLQQIESHLLMRHYDGLMTGVNRIKGRATTPDVVQ